MPRRPSGKVLLRPDAESLSVVDVAREGLLRQHTRAAGFVRVLAGDGLETVDFVPISSRVAERDGVLTIQKPWQLDIRVDTRIVGDAKYPGGTRLLWSFRCPGRGRPCGRTCRTLYRPANNPEDIFAGWGCKKCWHIRFPNLREQRKLFRDSHKEFRSELLRMRAEIDLLLQIPDLLET